MAHRLRFHTAIPDDLVNALDYYEEISPDLANAFRESVDRRLDEIVESPERFPVDIPPIRFAKVDRFPYIIFFKVISEFAYVVAIVHGSSDPEKWRSRRP
ncbi:MAG: type II toxin-antitoxin system RelE/ParE family toxin [Pirellulales bacterium]|nr:type II toxin-antitoxin system RelE/ParE family toxin [Pirellulales bacterium]